MVVPNRVNMIEGHSFYNSFIASVYIPDGVTAIGGYAFGECLNLTYMSLPKSLERIESCGIYHVENLKCIEFRGTMEEWNRIEIQNETSIPRGMVIICTDGEIVIE